MPPSQSKPTRHVRAAGGTNLNVGVKRGRPSRSTLYRRRKAKLLRKRVKPIGRPKALCDACAVDCAARIRTFAITGVGFTPVHARRMIAAKAQRCPVCVGYKKYVYSSLST